MFNKFFPILSGLLFAAAASISQAASHGPSLAQLETEFVGARGEVEVPARYLGRKLANGIQEIVGAPLLIAKLNRLNRLSRIECRKELREPPRSDESAHCHFEIVKKKDFLQGRAVYPSGLLGEPDDCAACGLSTFTLFTFNGKNWFIANKVGGLIEAIQFDLFVDGQSIFITGRQIQSGGGPAVVTMATADLEGAHIF